MTRIELVEAKKQELAKLDNEELVKAINQYFAANATLPGQKAVKMMGRNYEVTNATRDQAIEMFAEVCIAQVKVTNVSVYRDELDYPVVVSKSRIGFCDEAGFTNGLIPEGFRKNHPGIAGLKGYINAVDHSNGKRKTMTHILILDLMQAA